MRTTTSGYDTENAKVNKKPSIQIAIGSAGYSTESAISIVNDTFTDTGGVELQNHTADSGHSWTVLNTVVAYTIDTTPTFLGSSGTFIECTPSLFAIDEYGYVEALDSNVEISMNIFFQNLGSASSLGPVARSDGTDQNFLIFRAIKETKQIVITKVEAGSSSTLESHDFGTGNWRGIPLFLRFTVVADSLTGYAKNLNTGEEATISTTSTFNQTQTKHGVWCNRGGNNFQFVDNFLITTAPSTPYLKSFRARWAEMDFIDNPVSDSEYGMEILDVDDGVTSEIDGMHEANVIPKIGFKDLSVDDFVTMETLKLKRSGL